MVKDQFRGTGVSNPRDHGGMVRFVREKNAVGDFRTERGEGGIVGDVARGKDEGRVLFMEVCQGCFKALRMLIVPAYLNSCQYK